MEITGFVFCCCQKIKNQEEQTEKKVLLWFGEIPIFHFSSKTEEERLFKVVIPLCDPKCQK